MEGNCEHSHTNGAVSQGATLAALGRPALDGYPLAVMLPA